MNNFSNDKTNNSYGSKGSFTILIYNVAGLSEIISASNPKVNTKLISPKLNEYDVMKIQENFAYNKDLNSKLNFKFKTKFSGNVPFGDGLTTFSKYPLYILDKTEWKDRHGFLLEAEWMKWMK
jgi:hypothetical protein